MNFYKKAKEAVDYILNHSELTQSEISVQAGYKEQSLTQMLSSKDVSERAYKNILREFSEILNNSITEEQKNKGKLKNKNPLKSIKSQPGAIDSENPIQSLATSNSRLADAQIVLAEGNRRLIESNAEMVMILKSMLTGKPIVDELQLTQKEDHSRISVLEELVVELQLTNGLIKSTVEGYDKISKALAGDLQEGKVNRNLGAVDK